MERNEIRALLLNCLHEEAGRVSAADLRQLSAADWRTLRVLAIKKRVGPLLYARLTERGLDHAVAPDVMERLHKQYEHISLQTLRLYAEINKLARMVHDDDVPIILLKGAYLAAEVYGNIALREMNDLDILVRRRDLAKVGDALVALGYTPQRSYRLSELSVGLHLPRYVNPGAAAFEVHWNITPSDLHYSIDTKDLWERAVPATIAGVAVLGLSPEDLLLHVVMHTTYQHFFVMGLRPFCDVAAVVRRFGDAIEWGAVRQRAEQWGWRRGTYLALRLAKELVGAAVPEAILHDLRPADFDEAILAIAREQAFTDSVISEAISPGLAQLRVDSGSLEKAIQLVKMVFPSPQMMAHMYGTPPDSVRTYLYYPVRLKDVLMKRSRSAWRLMRGDQKTVLAADRNRALWNWLSE